MKYILVPEDLAFLLLTEQKTGRFDQYKGGREK